MPGWERGRSGWHEILRIYYDLIKINNVPKMSSAKQSVDEPSGVSSNNGDKFGTFSTHR